MRLVREAQVNPAIRWFVGSAVHEALPDHSSLTRIRRRWGENVFRRIFTRVVRQCLQAGVGSAGAVHIDASLIRANVSMDARVTRHLDAVEAAHDTADAAADHTGRAHERQVQEALPHGSGRQLPADTPPVQAPLATATSSRAPLRPACKQHTAVDDLAGVVVDLGIVTGEEHDTGRINERLDVIEVTLGVTPGRITADMIYGVDGSSPPLRTARLKPSSRPLALPARQGGAGVPHRAVQV